jgi:TonB-dependent receptor
MEKKMFCYKVNLPGLIQADNLKRALFFFGFVFFLTVHSVMAAAGSGTMKGKVYDRDTKDALPGATVLVKGTSIGASTDLNGDYVIHNVPSGEQVIVVSYVGYVSSTVRVNVPDGGTITKDFPLEATAVQGKAVVVTAQAQGQVQAINQQLSSNKIANIVSDAKIQELPDFNAAQAISRLPGVSVLQSSGEANKVVIRGLAPQYNEVAVGGITLASTGSNQIGVTSAVGGGAINNDRSVDLTMVTPYMIKSIEVYKTLTPDMEANAIGGYVNMDLREAPSGLHGDALWQSGYTQKSNTYGNYRAVVSLSDRFFGEKLGVYVLGNAEQYDRSADNMSAGYQTAGSNIEPSGYRPVRVTSVTLNRHVETRQRFGGNLILDYKLPSGSIKSVNMFSRLRSNATDYNTTLNYNSINHDIDFSYRGGITNIDLAVNSLELTNDFGFMSVDIKAANTYSRNHLPSQPYYTFFQNNALTNSVTGDTNVVPEDLAHFVHYGPDTLTLLGSTSLFSSDYHENDQVYKGDFKVPLNLGASVSGFFKFGGEYRYNYHTNAQSTPYISINRGSAGNTDINAQVVDSLLQYYPNLRFASTGQLQASNFTSTDPKLLGSFLDNKFGSVYWACNPGILNWAINYIAQNPALRAYNSVGGWFDGPYQNLPNTYKYIERYYAAYLMSELDLGPDFMVVGGARFEETKGLYHAYNLLDERNPAVQPYFPVTTYPENHYWLPMVQAKYNLAEWADVRYSYTQTLARPDYTQLSPHFVISADSPHQVWAGNPDLKPAQAYNHDLLLTLHSNSIGLLSVGGFYKEVKNFAYSTSYKLYSKSVYDRFGITGLDSLNSFAPFLTPADAGATLNTYINSRYKAYVKGIETDFETRFWYLPAPFNGIVLGINYTHIWSNTKYPYFDVKAARGTITQYIDSTRSGRLVYQPNDIMNSYIGYDYKGFSARVSFVFQGNSVTYVGAYPEQDGFSKNYFRVDASVRQLLPWKGLQLYLDANNLNSESNISAENAIGGFTSEQYYGLTANLGIRYTL